jgi:transposase-like protein
MWCWRCAPHAGVGPHSVSDPAAEIFRLRRENDWLRMERDIQKNCGIFSEPPK